MKKAIKQKTNKTMPLSVLNTMVAGIDVGASAHYVCVGSLSEESVRRFGTFTQDLEELADWLVSLGVESIAMESTGYLLGKSVRYLRKSRIESLFSQCSLCP
jgi:transposase